MQVAALRVCRRWLERFGKIVAYLDLGDVSGVGCVGGFAVADYSPQAFEMVAQAEVVPAKPERVGVAGSKTSLPVEGERLPVVVKDKCPSLILVGAGDRFHRALEGLRVFRQHLNNRFACRALLGRDAVPEFNRLVVIGAKPAVGNKLGGNGSIGALPHAA